MDRIDSMKYFIQTVESGSFSAASRKLEIPKSTINRGINKLEKYLGAKLLIRSTRKLTLTDIGQLYLHSCRSILNQVAESELIVANKQQTPTGELTVTAPVLFGNIYIVPLINEFLQKYPDIKIKLLLEDRVVNLQEECIDLAVRIGQLPDSNLVAKPVGQVFKVACASQDYLNKFGKPRHPLELDKHCCISVDKLDGGKSWRFYYKEKEFDVSIKPRLYTNSTESAIKAACDGLGITRVFSYQAEPWVNLNKLEIILDSFRGTPLPVSLLFYKHNPVPLKLRLLIDFLDPILKSSLKSFSMNRNY